MSDPSRDEEAARLLNAKPHSVRAHLLLGDQHAEKGDEQTAVYFYRQAVHLAEMQDLADANVVRARRELERVEARLHAGRERRLNRRGLPAPKRGPELAEARDIAGGRE